MNGKEVSGVSNCTPQGYLALESEGGECHFRNLMIEELPSTNPKPADCANVWEGHKSLFDGLTFTGFQVEKGTWSAGDGVLRPKKNNPLQLEKALPAGELIFDWKLPGKGNVTYPFAVSQNRTDTLSGNGDEWHRATIKIDKESKPVWNGVDKLELRNFFFKKASE
ncbi:MAG: hypothetical protein U0798_17030 [Gemmataceae bacterium]